MFFHDLTCKKRSLSKNAKKVPKQLKDKINYYILPCMNTQITDKVTVRLFVGCPLSSEIKMHLHQSATWKHATILPLKNVGELIEVHYHGKDYLGCYLTEDRVTLQEIEAIEGPIKKRLKEYCPTFAAENIKVSIFAQVFIA